MTMSAVDPAFEHTVALSYRTGFREAIGRTLQLLDSTVEPAVVERVRALLEQGERPDMIPILNGFVFEATLESERGPLHLSIDLSVLPPVAPSGGDDPLIASLLDRLRAAIDAEVLQINRR